MCHRWSLRRWSSRASTKSLYSSDLSSFEIDVSAPAESAEQTMKSTHDEGQQLGPLAVPLTAKFITTAIILSTAVAFSVGCIARIAVLSEFGVLPLNHHHINAKIYSARGEAAITKSYQLPAPTVLPGKDVPFTTYASKTFQVEGSATSHTLHIDRRNAATKVRHVAPMISSTEDHSERMQCIGGYCEEDVDQNASAHASSLFEDEEGEFPINDYSHNDDSDGLHLPAGQHLLVDIKDVDSAFLNSEVLLATAMVELISESKLTLLSYHCHSLVPIGVSCAGVLLESHVS